MENRYLSKLLLCFSEEIERFEDRIIALLHESIPGMSDELLPQWESDLGLPDTCSSLASTLDERQAVAHAKYTARYDGQSKQFYINYAAQLGATITVQEYAGSSSVFRVDKNRVDRDPIAGVDGARLWSITSKFKWIITLVNPGPVSVNYLICRFAQIAPAHTQIIWII